MHPAAVALVPRPGTCPPGDPPRYRRPQDAAGGSCGAGGIRQHLYSPFFKASHPPGLFLYSRPCSHPGKNEGFKRFGLRLRRRTDQAFGRSAARCAPVCAETIFRCVRQYFGEVTCIAMFSETAETRGQTRKYLASLARFVFYVGTRSILVLPVGQDAHRVASKKICKGGGDSLKE